MKKVLIATDKPFAPVAVNQITSIIADAGYELKKLEKYTTKAELLEAVKNVHAIIIRSDIIDREVISAADQLEIIVRAGAGYDNVDLSAASEKGVCVMNTPGQNSNAVAELVFGMLVFKARSFYNGNAGSELREKSIGIHAYGNVGRYVALIAKGFGMNVYAFDPFVSKEAIEKDGITAVDSVEELYSTCQYVSLHIPATEKTKKSINFDLLSKMPKGACLINTARKEVIDEEGILEIMEKRADFSYLSDIEPGVKDVFAEKYKGRYFFTPKKMGAQTEEANVNAGIAAAKQIVSFFKDGNQTFRVNK